MGSWRSYLVWGLAAIAGLYLIYFGLLSGMRKHESGEYGKIRALADPDSTYKIVILGSSRAETGVIPPLLAENPSDAFNFGFLGASVPFQKAVLQTLVAKEEKPQTVILCLDLHNLVKKAPVMYPNRFVSACSNATLREQLFALEPSLRWRYYFAPYGLMRLHDGEAYAGVRGYFSVETGFDQTYQRGYVPVPTRRDTSWMRKYPRQIQVDMDTGIITVLDEVRQLCEEHGTRLVLVAPPLHPAYKSRLDGLPEVRYTVQGWAATHDLHYLDMTDDPVFDDPNRFMDHTHVDPQGARLVTDRLRIFMRADPVE